MAPRIQNTSKLRTFVAVQFIELPFEGIDDYVCVPSKWVIVRRATDRKVVVAYPKNEDPFATRDRVKRKERYDDKWRFYMAEMKYESDTYNDAEYWIATRNDYGPLLEEELTNGNDTQPKLSKKSSVQNNQSDKSEVKARDNPRKPLMRLTIKRPGLLKHKKQVDKPLSTNKLSVAAVNHADMWPGSSKTEQSIINQNENLMEFEQTEETITTSNDEESLEQRIKRQRTEYNEQALSVPIIDVDTPTPNINSDKKQHSQEYKQPDKITDNCHSHFSNNSTVTADTATTHPITAEQAPQSSEHNNQHHSLDSGNSFLNFHPKISDVRSIATANNDHGSRSDNDTLNNGRSTSHQLLHSKKVSNQLFNQMNEARRLLPSHEAIEKKLRLENITRKMHNPSNISHTTESLPKHFVKEKPSMITQNQTQDVINSQQIHHNMVPRINVGESCDVTAADPKVVIQSAVNVTPSSQNFSHIFPHEHSSFVCQLDSQQNRLVQEECLEQSNSATIPFRETPLRSYHNQHVPVTQDYFLQEQRRDFTESNYFNHRADSRNIRTTVSSNTPNERSELPQRKLIQSNHQDTQQQSRTPIIRVGISIKPKTSRQVPALQGVTKRTVPSALSRFLKTKNNDQLNKQQLQAIRTGISTERSNSGVAITSQNIIATASRDMPSSEIPSCPHYPSLGIQLTSANENIPRNQCNPKQLVDQSTGTSSMNRRVHFEDDVVGSSVTQYVSQVMDSACQTDEFMEEPVSPYHSLTSDSDAHSETIADNEMSTEAPVSESPVADRPTFEQNTTSTNHQAHPRIVLEQQMLDNFATLFTQMDATLSYTCNMYNTLRTSILETAEIYRNLLKAVEKFNTMKNSPSNPSSSSNVTQDIPHATEERPTEVTATRNSSNNDQLRNNVVNKPPKKIMRFVLPPEYDPNDTRWTLKYRQNLPGLVELMPQSRIYVSCAGLDYAQQASKNCKKLARELLSEIFSQTALSVCLSITEKEQTITWANNVGTNVRPRLDEHASMALLNFVIEHGLQRGWNIDVKSIISTIDSKIQEMRFKYGVMARC